MNKIPTEAEVNAVLAEIFSEAQEDQPLTIWFTEEPEYEKGSIYDMLNNPQDYQL